MRNQASVGSPDPALVNFTATNLLAIRVAMAKRAARINFIGDSLLQGAPLATGLAPLYQNAVVGRLQAMIAADPVSQGGGANSSGICIPYQLGAYAETDARFTLGGTWNALNSGSAGYVLSALTGAAAGTPTLAFAPVGSPGLPAAGTCDNFNLFFTGTATGTYQVDGSAAVSYDFGAAAGATLGPGSVYKMLSISTGGAGVHTLTIAVSTGTLTYCGVEATLGTTGIRVSRIARGALSSTLLATCPLSTIHALTPGDLTIIDFGLINDFLNQVALATSQANITTLITSFLGAGSPAPRSVIGMVSPSPADAGTIPYTSYVTGLYTACQAAGIPIFDFSTRWVSNSFGTSKGLFFDARHPSLAGNLDFATEFHSLLRLCGVVS